MKNENNAQLGEIIFWALQGLEIFYVINWAANQSADGDFSLISRMD
jgi:hypothetical protein